MYKNTDKNAHKKKLKIVLITACTILAILVLCCFAYVSDYYPADDTAAAALVSDDMVTVEQTTKNMIVFSPQNPSAGLIFYPGGKVEYTAYSPLLHDLAAQGILCVLVKMPCNLAVLDINAAEGIQEMFPEIASWYIGGHSLGGSMAASYVAGKTADYHGLILLAAYATKDISQSDLNVLCIFGNRDGVLNMQKYNDNQINLPKNTEELQIEGGCHAQFGSYGTQKGDGTPVISGEEQRQITVQRIMDWIMPPPAAGHKASYTSHPAAAVPDASRFP